MDRRSLLKLSAGTAALQMIPGLVLAQQGGTFKIGSLTPVPSLMKTGHMNFSGPGIGRSNNCRSAGVRRKRLNRTSGNVLIVHLSFRLTQQRV